MDDAQKNLRCLQEVTDELLSHMKGHDWSFKREITDQKGQFSQEKLDGLVEEILSLWAAKLREGTDTDPNTGESLAEPYIRARRELYGSYLYLVMRSSLCQGAYDNIRRGGEKERTNFAFLLEQAKRLSQSWCVMAEPGGGKKNELFEGYDEHFGFHLYRSLADPENTSLDSALTPYWKLAMERADFLTDEGNMKRIYLKGFTSAPGVETAQADEEDDDSGDPEEDDDDIFVDVDDDRYDPAEDNGWDYLEQFDDADYRAARLDHLTEEGNRQLWLEHLPRNFVCQEEYLSACRRFVEIFERAEPEILRGFYEELEEIVDLYLAKREIAPLTDIDKALDVYSRVYDGALRQAKRYGRGIQWKNL